MKQAFLVGEGIYLRPLNLEDLEGNYLNWVNDRAVNKFLITGLWPTSADALKRYYQNILNTPTTIMFAIVDKKTDKHIGNIKLDNIDWINRHARCGRMIGEKEYWGKGCGTEAMRLVMDYAFKTLNLNRIYNPIVEDNIAAIRSCEKLGMKKEGIFSQFRFIDGRYRDVIHMAMTRDRYERLNNKKTHRA